MALEVKDLPEQTARAVDQIALKFAGIQNVTHLILAANISIRDTIGELEQSAARADDMMDEQDGHLDHGGDRRNGASGRPHVACNRRHSPDLGIDGLRGRSARAGFSLDRQPVDNIGERYRPFRREDWSAMTIREQYAQKSPKRAGFCPALTRIVALLDLKVTRQSLPNSSWLCKLLRPSRFSALATRGEYR